MASSSTADPGSTTSAAYVAGYNGGIIFGAIGTDTLVNYGTVSGYSGFVGASLLTGTVINGASGATGAVDQKAAFRTTGS